MARGAELLIAQIAIAKTGAAWLPFDADAPVERIADLPATTAAATLLLTDRTVARRKPPASCRARSFCRSRSSIADDRSAGRCARARLHARSSRLPDLHVRLDRHAQGHRHHRPQHLPLPALRQRDLRPRRERRRVPGRLRRLRSVDGGNLGALSRRRDACSWRRPRSMGEADKLPDVHGAGRRHRARHRADPARRCCRATSQRCASSSSAARPARPRSQRAGASRAAASSTPTVRPRRPSSPPSRKCAPASRSPSAGRSRTTPATWSSETLEPARPRAGRRTAHRRPRRRAGLSRPARAHRREVHRQSVRRPTARDPILYRSGDAVALDDEGRHSSSAAASTIRSRSAASASNSARSKRARRPRRASRQAAVVLRNDDGIDQLVAFVVPDRLESPDLDAKVLRAKLRETLPAYMVPARFEAVERTAAPRPPARSTASALKATPLARRRRSPRSRKSRAPRPKRNCSRPPKRVLPPPAHSLRRRFLHRSRRPFAARGAFRLGSCARHAPLAAHHPAGRLCVALAARHGRACSTASAAHAAAAARPVVHAAAAAAALPVRPRAGARAALHPRPRDGAMARRVRQLHAADRRRTRASWQEVVSLLGVYMLHQHRHAWPSSIARANGW